ncbi:GNAT family N-acetyltransferase [Neobacillus novalis]|uniref:GNAT family N-acetyltransferase n=1 Tax=Neobacillus novalis TaxID=220687 RepID=A0AA95S971_9BACI|nr:GNAT family N-acetyltransferase [Neobacillus novalis]WHY83939.1 GNAT family N-acetyltransferase [Neobacillus novalis]
MGLLNTITFKRIEELKDIMKVVELQAEIWSSEIVSPQPQLVASIHHGGILVGAFAEEKLVGFSYGFAGFNNEGPYLVSHMTGILPEYQNAGIGYHLKLKQREWAIDYGYKKIVWTYDPLEVRNGYFNVCKLGAYSKRYIPSYYGELNDKLNKGLPTDRLLIEWDICTKRVENAILGMSKNQIENLYETLINCEQASEFSSPIPLKIKDKYSQAGFRVPVPSNIQFIKQQKPEVAHEWRYAVRAAITEAFSKDYIITGVQKEHNSKIHYYILKNKLVEGSHD